MKVLIDINILLDFIQERRKFVDEAVKVFDVVNSKQIESYIGATSFHQIFHIMKKQLTVDDRQKITSALCNQFKVAPLDKYAVTCASRLRFNDIEDSYIVGQAMGVKADYIITRNLKDFKRSPIPAIAPKDFVRMVNDKNITNQADTRSENKKQFDLASLDPKNGKDSLTHYHKNNKSQNKTPRNSEVKKNSKPFQK